MYRQILYYIHNPDFLHSPSILLCTLFCWSCDNHMQDIMNSTAGWLSALMDNYKVMLYNGQFDLLVGGPLTERFLQVLEWSGQKDYLQVERKIWRIGDDVAGYVRQVGKFMQVYNTYVGMNNNNVIV